MDNYYFLILLILFYFYKQLSATLYEVKSFISLKKSLRILDDDISFLHEVKGDSNYLNYYYTTLYLGKDKMPQVYILDTGSSITASPCDQCKSCGNHLNPKYKLENTSKIIPCNNRRCELVSNVKCINNNCSFQVSYVEGSKLSGFYINEDVYFETIDNINNITNISYNIPIGCTTKETHLFLTQLADGIMGLNNNDKSFVSMLYKSKVIQNNIFSLCFSHEGGYFSIGKITTLHHLSKNISYVDLLNKNFGNYFIKLNYIKIGNTTVEYNGKAFIDSGTTLTYFPINQFQQIMKGFLKICEENKKCGNLRRIKDLGYCSKVKFESEIYSIISEGWSDIIVVLGGNEYIWKPENYYFIYNTESNGLNVCLGFEENARNNILLGTTFMHGHDIIFDKDKYRIGFVPADCNRIENGNEKEIDNNIKINDINNLEKIINDENDSNKGKNEEKINNLSDKEEPKFNENNKIVINNDTYKNILENEIVINTNKATKETKKKEINTEINQMDKIIDIRVDNITQKESKLDNDTNKKIFDSSNKINDINIPKEINTKNNTNNTKNDIKIENKNNIIKERLNVDKFMIIFSIIFTCCVFLIFIIFNIILCKESYIYIQNRKNDNNIGQYELEIPNEESNNPMSLFNDSI